MSRFFAKCTLAIVPMLLNLSIANACTNHRNDSLAVFRSVAKKLNEIKMLSYHTSCEMNYPSENYNSKFSGEMFVDFGKANDLAGFRYQYKNPATFSIYNNAEIIDGDKKAKTISITSRVTHSQLNSKTALYNSLVTIRNILSIIINDQTIMKSVADTAINDKSFYLLKYISDKKYPNSLGTAMTPVTEDITFIQKLIVDKETMLPVALLRTTKGTNDLIRTDFSNINLNPLQPEGTSWYYSSYLNAYKPEIVEVFNLIKPGTVAPEFKLTHYLNNTEESLSKYRGKLVLLEFWIKNCGYCVAAVPKLNAMNKQYADKDLQILAINTEDTPNAINSFVSLQKVEYVVLHGNNESVNKSYGIGSFPQVVLIDKTGRVIYSGMLDIPHIDEIIAKNK
jgi:thiol-disulfide isomerase/thioredoxin